MSRRISRYTRLTTPPTEADFRAVACGMLPDAGKGCHDLIAAYAMLSKHYMQAVVDVIGEARDLAETAKRKGVTFADVDAAISQRTVSDAAQVEALASSGHRPRQRSHAPAVAPLPSAPPSNLTLPSDRRAAAPALPSSRAMQPEEAK